VQKRLLRSRKSLAPLIALLSLGASALSHAQTGPIGQWPFDEGTGTTTADLSGNADTGTLVGSPVWAAGRVGLHSLTFNGSTNYVNVPNASGVLDNLQSTGNGMTVAAWINASGVGGGGAGRIFEKGGWFLAMSLNGSANVVKFTCQDSGGYRISTTVSLNTWIHIAATWDGGGSGTGMHLYVNGVLADGTSAAGTGGPGPDVGALNIGNRASDLAKGFTGSIDEARIYNRTLSASEIQALADSTAPSAPSTLSASPASSSQINLSWSASTDNVGVTGYLLERCAGTGCSSFVQVAAPTGTAYNDTGLSASTSYSYRVRATDANSNFSAYSSTATATTGAAGDTTPPTAPSSLSATATSGTQVNLSWTASTDNVGVTGYLIERCSGASCATFSQIGTSTTATYSDTTVSSGVSYSYRVRATDGAGNLSAYSNTATVTPSSDTQPPTAPSNLTVAGSASTELDLTWTASTDNVGVTGYLLERCQGMACSSFAQVATPSGTSYSDIGLLPGTYYSYRVRARDAANNLSPYSAILNAVTPMGSGTCSP